MLDTGVGISNPNNISVAFPAFLAKRPRCDKLRLCVDFRKLNEVTKDIIYPLPRIYDIIENMKDKSYFSIIDLKSGYWQLPLTERAKALCNMITQLGTFQYHVLPFGLKNAPAHFQRMMNKIFEKETGSHVFIYLDDIVIFSNTFEQHLLDLRQVLSKLKENNLQTNINKCHFCLSQLKLLGRIISEKGVECDPALTADMVNFPTPKNESHVNSFLALCNHYREFIDHFADISEPLSKLTRKNQTWVWSTHEISAFNNLKQAMASAPFLAFPDWNKSFVMQ
jgi:hypothetical protein